jgi:carboxymethylenebutenolidase
MQTIEVPFPRGTCPIHVFGTLEGSGPAVIMYPDAFGPRPAAFKVAEAIASSGWRVLMTTPFYEFLPFEPVSPAAIFEPGPGREKFMAMFATVTPENIDADVRAMLTFVAENCGADTPLAAVGYCMGGRYALATACDSEKVRFAGTFHAGRLAPAEGDGPHKRFGQVKGRIYIGAAGIDEGYDAAEHGRLAQALREADTDHIIENYKGAGHGWVFEDLPVYNRAAADRHHRRIAAYFSAVLTG